MTNIISKRLKLTESKGIINLDESIENITEVKVNSMSYIEQTSGQRELLLRIRHLNVQETLPKSIKFFKDMELPTYVSTPAIYTGGFLDRPEYKTSNPFNLLEIDYDIWIDDALATDVTALNPLFVNLTFTCVKKDLQIEKPIKCPLKNLLY